MFLLLGGSICYNLWLKRNWRMVKHGELFWRWFYEPMEICLSSEYLGQQYFLVLNLEFGIGADQFIVQRVLAAENESVARKATIFADF